MAWDCRATDARLALRRHAPSPYRRAGSALPDVHDDGAAVGAGADALGAAAALERA